MFCVIYHFKLPKKMVHCCLMYCRSGNFHVKNNSHKEFLRYLIFAVSFDLRIFFHGWRLQYGRVPGAFLAYYQVLGELGVAGCSRQSDTYLWERGCGLVHTFTHCCIFFFSHVKFSHVKFSHVKFSRLISDHEIILFS